MANLRKKCVIIISESMLFFYNFVGYNLEFHFFRL